MRMYGDGITSFFQLTEIGRYGHVTSITTIFFSLTSFVYRDGEEWYVHVNTHFELA